MQKLFGRLYFIYFIGSLILLSLFMTTSAQAQVVDEIKFKQLSDGYQITVNLLLEIQYQSHAPNNPAKQFYAQLKTINFRSLTNQEIDSLRKRQTWGPDPTSSIPLQQIIFEGGDPERPQMTFIFTEEVQCDMRSSGDLRSLIIKVKTKQPPVSVSTENIKVSEKKIEKKTGEFSLPEKVISKDQVLASLMEDARDTLIKKQYGRAILLYTKILQTAQGAVKQQAQELLGVAYERNGQLAHAKAEYEKYLKEFPKGPDSERVRQRLLGLITAATTPKEKLKAAKRAAGGKQANWSMQNFGTLSQFYFYDQTIPEGGAKQVNRADLSTDLDFNSRLKNDDWDINTRFTGGYLNNFVEGGNDRGSISALSIEMRSKKTGLYGKFGRQSLSNEGVFGRFDGAHLAAKLNSVVKMNAVFGFPVDSPQQTSLKTDRRFYGINFDFGTFLQKWNFNTYFINQQNHGLTDRRAIGAEVRYFDPTKAFFTLLDYDVFFKTINMFLFNGHWTLPTKTTFNLILDYRKSPLLTLNNAIIGQGVNKLSDLLGLFSKKQLKQMAEDRTTNSKMATFNITQDLTQNIQLVLETTISEMEGTISSSGVDGQESPGKDYSYSAQLVTSNVLKQNDVIIYGLTYLNGSQNNTYTLDINGSFPVTQKLRVMPKFRLDFSNAKNGGVNTRSSIRPSVRLDYNLTKSTQLEVEGGIDWINEKSSGIRQQSTESFITLGYRINF